jgi:hypothetical protein
MKSSKENSPCPKCKEGSLVSIIEKQQVISLGEVIEVPSFTYYECSHCRRTTLDAKEFQRAMQYLDYYHYSYSNEPFELYPVKTSKIAAVC